MNEIWKDMHNAQGYQISSLGKIKSLPRLVKTKGVASPAYFVRRTGKVRVMSLDSSGYLSICIRINGLVKTAAVHRLVAEAFIPNPENKRCVNHKNGIKTDNRVENLEWATHSENSKHSFATGLQSNKGEQHPGHKLSEVEVRGIRDLYSSGKSAYGIRKNLYPHLSYTTIKDIVKRRIWNHI